MQKNFYFKLVFTFLFASWRSKMKIEGSRSASGSGSISQRHGSADPDPDPHQNVMDPQHWLLVSQDRRHLFVTLWCKRILKSKTADIAYREYRDTRRPSRQRPASWARRGRPPHPEQPPRLLTWRIFYRYRFYRHRFYRYRFYRYRFFRYGTGFTFQIRITLSDLGSYALHMHGPIQSRETVPTEAAT